VPEPTSRRRFRIVYWSLFALADIGLGVWLHDVYAYRPRCEVPLPSGFVLGLVSRNGDTAIVKSPEQPFNQFLGGGLAGAQASANSNDFTIVDLRHERSFACEMEAGVWGLGLGFTLSPQEKFLAIAGAVEGDESLILVEMATGTILKRDVGEFVGFSSDDRLLITKRVKEERMTLKTTLEIWDTATRKPLRVIENVSKPSVSRDGRKLETVVPNGLLIIELPLLESRLHPVPEQKTDDEGLGAKLKIPLPLTESNLSPDKRLVAASTGSTLMVWDADSGRLRWDLAIAQDEFFAFTPDSSAIVLSRDDFLHYDVLEAGTGKWRHSILSPVTRTSFSSDHRLVTVHSSQPTEQGKLEESLGDWSPFAKPPDSHLVRVIDVAAGIELARLTTQHLQSARVSDDGSTLITTHKEGDDYYLRAHDLPIPDPPR